MYIDNRQNSTIEIGALASPISGEPFFINCVLVSSDWSLMESDTKLLVTYMPRIIPTIIGTEMKYTFFKH